MRSEEKNSLLKVIVASLILIAAIVLGFNRGYDSVEKSKEFKDGSIKVVLLENSDEGLVVKDSIQATKINYIENLAIENESEVEFADLLKAGRPLNKLVVPSDYDALEMNYSKGISKGIKEAKSGNWSIEYTVFKDGEEVSDINIPLYNDNNLEIPREAGEYVFKVKPQVGNEMLEFGFIIEVVE